MSTCQSSPHPLPRPNAALERAADELLRASLQTLGLGEYPFHTERWLREMRRREERSGRVPPPAASLSSRVTELLDELLAQAPLTPRQRTVLVLSREGLRLHEIAAHLRRPLSTVARWRQKALAVVRRHLRTTAVVGSGGGVAQVYREETRRTAYEPERHCAAGREACRRDGCCRYRWYLYQPRRG